MGQGPRLQAALGARSSRPSRCDAWFRRKGVWREVQPEGRRKDARWRKAFCPGWTWPAAGEIPGLDPAGSRAALLVQANLIGLRRIDAVKPVGHCAELEGVGIQYEEVSGLSRRVYHEQQKQDKSEHELIPGRAT